MGRRTEVKGRHREARGRPKGTRMDARETLKSIIDDGFVVIVLGLQGEEQCDGCVVIVLIMIGDS